MTAPIIIAEDRQPGATKHELVLFQIIEHPSSSLSRHIGNELLAPKLNSMSKEISISPLALSFITVVLVEKKNDNISLVANEVCCT